MNKINIRHSVSLIVITHLMDRTLNKDDKFDIFGRYGFYLDRLKEVPFYGLEQGRDLIKMICRSAFNDSSLTDNEAIVIMETCLDPALDNILLEVNFNEGW